MHIERERETERRIKGGVFINGKEERKMDQVSRWGLFNYFTDTWQYA